MTTTLPDFMPRESSATLQARTRKIIARLRQAYPDAHCELNHANPLELLVAEQQGVLQYHRVAGHAGDARGHALRGEQIVRDRGAEDVLEFRAPDAPAADDFVVADGEVLGKGGTDSEEQERPKPPDRP